MGRPGAMRQVSVSGQSCLTRRSSREPDPGPLGVLARAMSACRDRAIFRRVFERFVGACIGAGLVGGERCRSGGSSGARDRRRSRFVVGARQAGVLLSLFLQ